MFFCNFTPQTGLHISCAIRPLAAMLEEFPCCSLKRMSQWIQPQPESLYANICVMRHTGIKPSASLRYMYIFSSYLYFLASNHIEVHPQDKRRARADLTAANSHTPIRHLRPAFHCLCERTVSSAWLQALCGDAITG